MVVERQARRALREERLEQEREITSIRKRQWRAIDTKAVRDETMEFNVKCEREEIERKRKETGMTRQVAIARTGKRLIEHQMIERAEHKRVMDANEAKREKTRREW